MRRASKCVRSTKPEIRIEFSVGQVKLSIWIMCSIPQFCDTSQAPAEFLVSLSITKVKKVVSYYMGLLRPKVIRGQNFGEEG